MRPLHLLLSLLVVAIWGTNFVVIRWALDEMPPFLLATLRFALCAVPWIFFIPRPAVPMAKLAAFGLLLGAGQFGLLYWAMRQDITPGLASLAMQSQVFFTIVLAMAIYKERVRPRQAAALVLAASGIGLIGWQAWSAPGASITPFGFLLILGASSSWGLANIVVRSAGKVNPVAFIVWSSPASIPVLALVSLVVDGPAQVLSALGNASLVGWGATVWQAWANTLVGFAAWNWLLTRYPSHTVAPTALLVPVFGMGASALLLGEALQPWKLAAAAVVIAGLGLNAYFSRQVRA